MYWKWSTHSRDQPVYPDLQDKLNTKEKKTHAHKEGNKTHTHKEKKTHAGLSQNRLRGTLPKADILAAVVYIQASMRLGIRRIMACSSNEGSEMQLKIKSLRTSRY